MIRQDDNYILKSDMKTPQTECEKFAARLIEAMLDNGQQSQRKSATGVTTIELKKVAGVTNEMARRYTLGQAWPDNEKMAKIARWLKVREAWLRYNEGPKRLGEENLGDGAKYQVADSADHYAHLNTNDMILLRDSIKKVSDLLFMFEGKEPDSEDVARGAVALFNRASKAGEKISEISPTEVTSICEAAFSHRS